MRSILLLILAVLVACVWSVAAQSFSIDWATVQSSASSSGGPFSISDTIGQAEVSAGMSGGEFSVGGGFWSLLSGDSGAPSPGLVNGNFEDGFAGFTSDYIFVGPGGSTGPGKIAIGTSPRLYDSGLAAFGDHTTGSGNMLIVDASTQGAPLLTVWQETVQVSPGHYYGFSAWVAAASDASRAVLRFTANGAPLGPEFTPAAPVGVWQNFRAVWNSAQNTSVTLSITDLNTNWIGNDFALDDITLDEIETQPLPHDGLVLYCRVNPTSLASTIWLAAVDGSSDTMITNGYRAHLSLDRRYLVFTRDGPNGPAYGSRGFIWVHDLLDGSERQLFSHGDYVIGADFVRDASSVIFDYSCANFIINRDGSGLALLANGISGCYDDAPVVNPIDGRVALHAASGGGAIILGDPNCQNKSYVPNSDLGVYPHWSQDGQWISYAKQLDYYQYAGHNLYKIRPDGTGKTQLTFFSDSSTNQFPEGGAWTADGSALIAAGTINGSNGLYQIATDGSGLITPVAVSRNGDLIAYVGAVLGDGAPQIRILGLQRFGGDLLLSHTSQRGHAYALESAPDPANGPWLAVPGTTNLGTGASIQITLSNALSGPRQFYRVHQTQ
jgi:hypothetical protein